MTDVAEKLAQYEEVLRDAAARQIDRRHRRRRRLTGGISIALPVLLLAGVAGAQTGVVASIADELGVTSGPTPGVSAPADPATVQSLSNAAGVGPRDSKTQVQWTIAGHRVVGYTTASGDFCYEFVDVAGGCLQPGTLTNAMPLDTIVGYGLGTFQVLGLATNDVVAVEIEVGDVHEAATMGPNSFFYENDALDQGPSLHGLVIATMKDGTTRTILIHVNTATNADPIPSLSEATKNPLLPPPASP